MMRIIILVYLIAIFLPAYTVAVRLSVCSNNKKFCYNGAQVYLSGMNQAWYSYARDFGNNYYQGSRQSLIATLSGISLNGGNSIRIWLHTTSNFTPHFNNDGSVGAADSSGTNQIIEDMKDYLCAAERYNIIVFFVLWNGADPDWKLNPQWAKQLNGLITDDYKLDSYISNCLIPIVQALKGFSSLGGYDIINEPEGVLYTHHHSSVCFNTQRLSGTGAGWASNYQFPNLFWMHRLQRFVNWQAHAIKLYDPASLVTVGSWRENTQYNSGPWNTFNYFSDFCLLQAGGRFLGKLDFYQMHTYVGSNQQYSNTSPMIKPAFAYNLNKPLVIGEFSKSGGDARTIEQLVQHAYNQHYAGAWSWHAVATGHHHDTFAVQAQGLRSIRCRAGVSFLLLSVHKDCRYSTDERLQRAPRLRCFFSNIITSQQQRGR